MRGVNYALCGGRIDAPDVQACLKKYKAMIKDEA